MMKMKTLQKLALISMLGSLALSVFADTLYDNRFKRWQTEAEKGNARSQYSLGNAYLRGNEVKIDINEAIKWFEAAAKQGHSKSEYKLGYIYYTGRGIKRDNEKAVYWFKRSAEKNYAPAQFYLGKCYADGTGVKQDTREALAWLNKSKANDYSPAGRVIASLQQENRNATSSTANSKAPAPAAADKTIAKAPAKPKKTAPIISKNSKIDVLDVLQLGDWKAGKKPAENMPSDITECKYDKLILKCETKKLSSTNPFAEITYQVESKFSHFNDKGEFMAIYRRNNLMVIPSDPDDPEPNAEYIPKTGWTANSVMKCKIESEKNITCFTDSYQKVSYSR